MKTDGKPLFSEINGFSNLPTAVVDSMNSSTVSKQAHLGINNSRYRSRTDFTRQISVLQKNS